jgi:hypothetical protein
LADWVVQQWRQAFPEADPYRYAILDRDSIFDADVMAFLNASGLRPKRTSRRRSVETKPAAGASLISLPSLGGLTIATRGAERHRRPSLSDSKPARRCAARLSQAVPATTRTLAHLRRSGS